MRRLFVALTVLSVVGAFIASATLPIFESSTNKEGQSTWAKRKGYGGAAGGDTLYAAAANTDTTIIYYRHTYTGAQPIVYTATDTSVVTGKIVLCAGHVAPTPGGYFVQHVDSTTFTGNGLIKGLPFTPRTYTIPVCEFFFFTVTGVTPNCPSTKVRIRLTRD